MAIWKLYIRDVAPQTVVLTSVGVSAASNAVNGYDTMYSALTASPGYWQMDLGSAYTIRAYAIGNHTLGEAGGSAAHYYQYSDNGSTWTPSSPIGTTVNAGDNSEILFETGVLTHRYWRVGVSGASTQKVGCVSLLLGGNYYIPLTNVSPRYEIQRQFHGTVGRQQTVSGNIIEQRRGGAFRIFTLDIPYADLTTAANEGLIDDMFFAQLAETAGWLGPFWLVDDGGIAYHVYLERPLDATLTDPGLRSRLRMTFRTTAQYGLIF